MTFVVSSQNESRLRKLTELLFSEFQGITVYQYMNAGEAAACVKTHHVDAVYIDGEWDAQGGFPLLRGLRQDGVELPIYVFADSDQHEEDAMWHGATGYFVK